MQHKFFLVLALISCSSVVAQNGAPASEIFSYDRSAPIRYNEKKIEGLPDATVFDISYDSPKVGRVPGYIVVPTSGGHKFAGIVYMHWGQGNRGEFLAEAREMASRGAVSIMIDAPYWRRDVPSFQPLVDADKERNMYIQLVVDLRRAVDILVARPDVDPKRIGYVGHSLGATWGGPLAAVEKRVKIFVLMGGLPWLTNYDDDSFYGELQRASTPRDKFEQWAETIEPINPEHFAGQSAPGKLYFQWAQHDLYISKQAADRYFATAGNPKEQKWYFTSHEFNDRESHVDRVEWLSRELSLSGHAN